MDDLARFGSQQLSIAIDAAVVAVDKFHRLAAYPAIRPGSPIDHRKIRKFEILVVIGHSHGSPILCALRPYLEPQGLLGTLPRRHADEG